MPICAPAGHTCDTAPLMKSKKPRRSANLCPAGAQRARGPRMVSVIASCCASSHLLCASAAHEAHLPSSRVASSSAAWCAPPGHSAPRTQPVCMCCAPPPHSAQSVAESRLRTVRRRRTPSRRTCSLLCPAGAHCILSHHGLAPRCVHEVGMWSSVVMGECHPRVLNGRVPLGQHSPMTMEDYIPTSCTASKGAPFLHLLHNSAAVVRPRNVHLAL